jgi:hypothetical protein
MKIDPGSLEELKQICLKYLQRELTDSEAQDTGQRIVRFLANSERRFPTSREVDAN